MKKVYLCLFVAFTTMQLSAQRTSDRSKEKFTIKKPVNLLKTNAAGCDTVNIPFPASWNVTYYNSGTGGSGGFVAGVNNYNDLQKANYFDVSSTANTYLTKVWLAFGKANGGNMAAVIPIRVYDGTTGVPGALLGTQNTTLGNIRADVLTDDFHEVVFSTPVSLPTSKKFFVSVDISNLSWSASPKDSLTLYSTTDGDAANTAWEQWEDGDWYAFNDADAWGLDVTLLIHPFVSTNTTCATLPVTLANFYGETKGEKNILKWLTATESNNAGFEIQRSANGETFSTIDKISTKAENGNSTTLLSYVYEDKAPLTGTNYYRLKQVDKDGKFSYSTIVTLKTKATDIRISSVYPNPTRNELNLVIIAPSAQKTTIIVTDLTGKMINQKPIQLNAGDNLQQLNTQQLAPGTYLVKVICDNGCETTAQRFVKF